MGKAVLGPVPVPRNEDICLYPDKPLSSSKWSVFDLTGRLLASKKFGREPRPCWGTAFLPPGVYVVRLELVYADGDSGTTWQKVLVSK